MKSLRILSGLAGGLAIGACIPGLIAQQPPKAPKPPKPPEARTIQLQRQPVSYLGIGVADVDAEQAKALNLKEVRGAEIKSVAEDSPAAKVGLREGDVVLDYNNERVEGMEQLVRLVRETPPGRQVSLSVWRNGAIQKVDVTVASRSEKWWGSADGGKEFSFTMPPMPPLPPMPPVTFTMPDLPRNLMAWRSSALGLESESLTTQLAEFFGVKEGVLVRSVTPNSPADKAGIKAGDVIVKISDTHVTNPREISSALRSVNTKTFPLVIVRNRKEMTVTVTVDESQGYRGVRPVQGQSRSIGNGAPIRDC